MQKSNINCGEEIIPMRNELSYAYNNNIAVIVTKNNGIRFKGKIEVFASDHIAINTGISTAIVFFKTIASVDILNKVH
jgi:sRNA-binding regulator protein Hfq